MQSDGPKSNVFRANNSEPPDDSASLNNHDSSTSSNGPPSVSGGRIATEHHYSFRFWADGIPLEEENKPSQWPVIAPAAGSHHPSGQQSCPNYCTETTQLYYSTGAGPSSAESTGWSPEASTTDDGILDEIDEHNLFGETAPPPMTAVASLILRGEDSTIDSAMSSVGRAWMPGDLKNPGSDLKRPFLSGQGNTTMASESTNGQRRPFDDSSTVTASSAGNKTLSGRHSITSIHNSRNGSPAPRGGTCTTITSKRVRRKKCSVGACRNRAVQGGVCISHGARRKACEHPGCAKRAKYAGLCSSHGPARKRCETVGCNKVAVQGGRCIAHGARKRLCSIEGCTKKAVLVGVCKRHYDQRYASCPLEMMMNQGPLLHCQSVVVAPTKAAPHPSPPATSSRNHHCNPVTITTAVHGPPSPSHHTRGLSIFEEITAESLQSLLLDD